MNKKKIKIRIGEDGQIFAETIGLKGKECLTYIEQLEKLLDAETIDSNYTAEYYETEINSTQQNTQLIREEE
ncbi:DUF2997 domain-containing protein [Pseudalkalibacillus sp. SCS-8]|uniref:DUF2997 domain-containing protein n=1 Tax=Pseudalkalibacillus nanhaiensis TaxID=3115291 RepID=UPI0032DA26CD